MINNNKLLISVYSNPKAAECAYNTLIEKGYYKKDISVIMSDQTRNKYFVNTDLPKDNLKSKVTQGMGMGGTIGGAIGALAAAIAAVGTILTFPGLGIIVAGPIAASLAGAGAGGAAGTLVGALVGSGFTDEYAKQYEEEIKGGKILVIVKTSNDNYNNLENELKNIKEEIEETSTLVL